MVCFYKLSDETGRILPLARERFCRSENSIYLSL